MLQAYSLNLTINTNPDGSLGIPIPLNNINIEKGCTAKLIAPATIQFNKCGVYMVSMNASVTATQAGEITIQLLKNNILQPQAKSTVTGSTTNVTPLNFATFVQVQNNNSNCCCISPTTIQLMSTDTGFTGDINVCVSKLC